MVKEVRLLKDEFNTVNEILSIHRGELNKVHKELNQIEQEIQIVQNLSQSGERDNNLEERLDLNVQDLHETLNYHQGFIESG